MSKHLAKLIVLSMLFAGVLFSIGAEGSSEQGTSGAVAYHGEVGPDSHGWLIVADFEKVGDDVVSAKFDCILLNKYEYAVEDGLDVHIGDSKADLSRAGIYNLKLAGATLDWHEQIALVEDYLVEHDSFDGFNFDEGGHDVDAVTGATIHFSEFVEAFEAAKPLAQATVTTAIEGAQDAHGWQPYIIYQTVGTDVVSATIDCFLADPSEYVEEGMDAEVGDLKTDLSKEGIYDLKTAGATLDWHEQIALVEAYLVENDGFAGISFDDSGHDVDGITGATIHFSEFTSLVD